MSRKRKDAEFAAKIAARVEELGERANVHVTEGKMRIRKLIKAHLMVEKIEHDRTIADVAAEIGMSVSTLRRLEAGKQVPDGPSTLKIINWLFSEEPDDKPQPEAEQPVVGEVAEG